MSLAGGCVAGPGAGRYGLPGKWLTCERGLGDLAGSGKQGQQGLGASVKGWVHIVTWAGQLGTWGSEYHEHCEEAILGWEEVLCGGGCGLLQWIGAQARK